MSRSHTVLSTLLVVVAVLLTLNLVVPIRAAVAQPSDKVSLPGVVPVSVAVAPEESGEGARWLLFRLWSDGTVDVNHVGQEDVVVPRNCDGRNVLTESFECFPGWQVVR